MWVFCANATPQTKGSLAGRGHSFQRCPEGDLCKACPGRTSPDGAHSSWPRLGMLGLPTPPIAGDPVTSAFCLLAITSLKLLLLQSVGSSLGTAGGAPLSRSLLLPTHQFYGRPSHLTARARAAVKVRFQPRLLMRMPRLCLFQ